MFRIAINLTMAFSEYPFLDRFAVAADHGFKAVEVLFPYEAQIEAIARRLESTRLTLLHINAPVGNRAAGERGLVALPGREAEFQRLMDQGLTYAWALGVKQMHVSSGVMATGVSREQHEETCIANLQRAADRAAEAGVTLLLEPHNHKDAPGFLIRTNDEAISILDRVDKPNVKLLLDFYHCQVAEGNLTDNLRRLAGRYAYIQLAGAPGRTEPDRGEINYRHVLTELAATGYEGWIGAEYVPAAGTLAGLGWAKRWFDDPSMMVRP